MTCGWLARAAVCCALLLAAGMAPFSTGASDEVGTVGSSNGVIAVSRSDGTAFQPAPRGLDIRAGDSVATAGPGTSVLELIGGFTLQLGGLTTLEVVRFDASGLVIRLVEGAVVLSSSSPLPFPLTIEVQDRTFTVPDRVARSGWSIGLSRSPDSQVILVCDRCPADAGFTDESETLDSGRMRTYDSRGDSFESKFNGSIFTALAEFPDDGSSVDKLPIGQRSASIQKSPKDDDGVAASAGVTWTGPSSSGSGPTGVSGSASGPGAAGTATPTPTSTITSTPTPTPTATQTKTPTTVNATIAFFIYLPDPVRVPVGSAIEWKNFDFDVHTVTASDRSWTSPVMQNSETFKMTFNQVGTIAYFCEPHPQMTGTIIVE
jgi:plastocyanin